MLVLFLLVQIGGIDLIKELEPLELNELYFAIHQASLFNITKSLLSISFEIWNNNDFYLRIIIIRDKESYELECLKKIEDKLISKLKMKYKIIFELIEVDGYKISNLNTLKYEFYFDNKVFKFIEEEYEY